MTQRKIKRHEGLTSQSGLSNDQAWDLHDYVTSVGRETRTMEPPQVPDQAVSVYAWDGPDAYTVWLLDGWPVAASNDVAMVSWAMPWLQC